MDVLKELKAAIEEVRELSQKARAKSLDPTPSPESTMVLDLPSLVEALVGPQGVASVIRELCKSMEREEVALKTADKILSGSMNPNASPEKLAEQAIRTGLALLTEGVTAAPVQGISSVKIKGGPGNQHLAVYFAGPIRSAGGTDQALTVVLSDYVRQCLGLQKFVPSKELVGRTIEEIRLYERAVTRFQYHFSDDNLRYAIERLPIEVTGIKTDNVEVSTYRNVPGVETNCIRGGALLVVNDGVIGRASKVMAITEKIGLEGWDWLKGVVPEKTEDKGIMDEVIAGRPVFSSNKLVGGFRLRYGRSRNTGLAGIGVHPLAMKAVREFLAIGTQMRMDVPGKGGVVMPVDYLEPPIIKLEDESVVQLTCDDEIPKKFKVLFLGDVLISFGDFLYSNKSLLHSPYVEEWWSQDLQRKMDEKGGKLAEKTKIPCERLKKLASEPFFEKPSFDEAQALAQAGVPLHPKFTFFWNLLASSNDVAAIRNWITKSCKPGQTDIKGDFEVKLSLEKILVPHQVKGGQVVITGDTAAALKLNVGYGKECQITASTPLEAVNTLSGVTVMDKVGAWVNARMGRPEKARRREMKPVVHVLFPVGFDGGSRRNILDLAKKDKVRLDLEIRRCPRCGTETHLWKCPNCGGMTAPTKRHTTQEIKLKPELDEAMSKARAGPLKLLKGVKGLMNETKTPEPLVKGILRAKYDLSVFRDGTVRFDVTNAPLTHFKPAEIKATVEQARDLGYDTDWQGKPLTSADQVCTLKYNDIIIARKAAKYLVKAAQFMDELLTKFYGEPAFYNLTRDEELIGHLIVGLAPHTLCGVFGRIIGITESQVCYAHPIWHSAKRRDCFPPETVITVKDSEGSVRNVQIKSLVEEKLMAGTPRVVDDVGTEGVPGDGLEAAALNRQTGKVEFQPINLYLKGKMGKSMISLTTKSGREASVTPYHKALVFKNAEWQKAKTVEVEEGETVPVAYSIPIEPQYHSEQKIDLYRELLNYAENDAIVIRNVKPFIERLLTQFNKGKRYGFLANASKHLNVSATQLGDWVSRDSIPIRVMAKLLEITGEANLPEAATIGVRRNEVTIPHLADPIQLARFLGLITAEGWMRENYYINQVVFRNTSSKILEEYDQLVRNLFGLVTYTPPNEWDKRYLGSKVILTLLKLWGCGKTSHVKRVAAPIMNGDTAMQSNFLATFVDGNGTVISGLRITLYTSSKLLQYDLSVLLGFHGVACSFHTDAGRLGKTVKAKYQNRKIPPLVVHRINVTGQDAVALAKLLLSLATIKDEKLKTLATREIKHSLRRKTGNVFLDKIKAISSLVQPQNDDYCVDVAPYHTILINGGFVMGQCDGDEDALMLATDCMINFSKTYLPEKIGGIMDAPILLSSSINLNEIQRQALEMDIADFYPPEFYEATKNHGGPKTIVGKVRTVKDVLSGCTQSGFTIPTSDISRGNAATMYSRLPTMTEKIDAQFSLMEDLAGVDVRDVALKVLTTHFLRDIIGNLRAYTTQTFRCKSCNRKYRRPPLQGNCPACHGELTPTVHRGGIEKYLETTDRLIEKYNLPAYYAQRIQLVKDEINLLFGPKAPKKDDKQQSLASFI